MGTDDAAIGLGDQLLDDRRRPLIGPHMSDHGGDRQLDHRRAGAAPPRRRSSIRGRDG
jgi:hypothetical protein